MSTSSSELARVELLRAIFSPTSRDARVLVGIGDDEAVLEAQTESLVWTVDAAVDGVHFRRGQLALADIGYRATMAAASDLAAMGANPLGLLAALILPADLDDDALAEIARGQRAAADDLGSLLIGGNLARGSELSITTTVLGTSTEPMKRSGARIGDAIWLAGDLGLAAAGRFQIERGIPAISSANQSADRAFRRPIARIAEGLAARAIATAAIDVSDGLVRDLGHIARASDVRAVIDPETIVSAELREVAASLGMAPLDLALHGGDDYALVVVAAGGARLDGFRRIGGCEARGDAAHDVALVSPSGEQIPAGEHGFDHFARS